MTRDRSIDIAKAIAIILMVVGHCENLPYYFFTFIFSFHLPLFFIFSGYFYRQKSYHDLLVTDLSKLVRPYVLTSLVGALISLILYSPSAAVHRIEGALAGCMGSGISMFKLSPYQAGPIWFLMALFWCRMIFNIIYRNWSRYYLPISIVIGLLFWILGRKIINLPLCFCVGCTGTIFYAAGLWLKEHGLPELKYRIMLYSIWAVAIVFCYLNMAQYVYSKFPISILGAIGGTIAIWQISLRIQRTGLLAGILVFIGEHTLEILCCHHIAFLTRDWLLGLFSLEISIVNLNIALVFLTFLYSGCLWGMKYGLIKRNYDR